MVRGRNILLGDAVYALEQEIRFRRATLKTMTLSAGRFWEDQKAILDYGRDTVVLEQTIAQIMKAAAVK